MGCKNCGAEFDYCQCPPGGAWEDPNSPAICDDCGWPLKRESQEFCGYNAKPAALSPDMLGEEDREALAYVKQLVLDYRRRMSLKRIEIGNSNDADVVWYYDNEVEQAHKGVLLLLRLLGSADAKGGE